MKNKRAISVMIGYVLLISFGIILGALIYQGMKTYIPQEPLVCPDGVSVSIKDITCEKDEFGNVALEYTIKNNGRFTISGYFIRATTSEDAEFATLDLSSHIYSGGTELLNSVGFVKGLDYNLKPNIETKTIFVWEFSELGEIYSIEITPTRVQKTDGSAELVSCTNSKVIEKVSCK